MGRTLVYEVERTDVAALLLKDVLNYDTKQAISFFVGLEILKNEKACDICGAAMLTEKMKERVDGIQLLPQSAHARGDGRYVEIDEYSICRRKYNRGRSRVGASQWVFGGAQRGDGGCAFAFRVQDRKKKTLLNMIRNRILPGTIIVKSEVQPSSRTNDQRIKR
uniref:Transposase n=1 Tax=Ditylenchus dipsaci TaxID=166011 RepID=A0A915DW45_9BILA